MKLNEQSSDFGILSTFLTRYWTYCGIAVFGDLFCDIAVFVNFFAVLRCSEPPNVPLFNTLAQ